MLKQIIAHPELKKAVARLDKKALAVISSFVVLVFALMLIFAPQRTPASNAAAATLAGLNKAEATAKSATEAKAAAVEVNQEDILWLARGIYSETKKPHEQELVAWVIRNRVETEYRGKDNYKEVVLDPWQFSAFNSNSPVRRFYTTLTESSESNGWKTAIGIAERVAKADTSDRPFPKTTRHFYSEQSMKGSRKPVWALEKAPVKLGNIEERRFRFYADVH